ncbi:MAG: hypothetical protein ACFFAU_08240 [Candidatus Hodarchaeota archaeon]
MNKQVESVEQYLNEVSRQIGTLADKDQIITELRAHIWDLANQLSIDKGFSVQEAFDHAILRMEDPQILASKFLDEEPGSTKVDWRTPITTPESKIKNEQFLLIAIIGIASVALMAFIIPVTTSTSLQYTVFLLSLIFGTLAIGMFVAMLYFYDERLFHEQIGNLRKKFLKPLEDKKVQKATTKKFTEFEVKKPTRVKTPSFWGAFGEHLGGLFGGLFIGITMILFFAIDITQVIPLYNENWYFIGSIALYISLGASFVESLFKLIFGRIRATRLVSASTNIIAAIGSVILIMYYPFTFELAINTIFTNAEIVIAGIPGVFDLDTGIKIFIGIVAIIQILSALYDIFKFGAWKPSDRRSLI